MRFLFITLFYTLFFLGNVSQAQTVKQSYLLNGQATIQVP